MKNIIKFSLLCFAAIGLARSASAQQAALTLVPVSTNTVGSEITTTFDLNISGLGYSADEAGPGSHSPALGAFDVTLDFNSDATFVSFTFGDPVNGNQMNVDGNADTQTIFSPGVSYFGGAFTQPVDQVELMDTSNSSAADLETSQLEAFTLGQVTFSGEADGIASISIDPATNLGDENGNPIANPAGVPEPSTYASLIFGALGLLCWGAKTRRKPSVA